MSYFGNDLANTYAGTGIATTIKMFGGNDTVVVNGWSNSSADGGTGYDSFKIYSVNDRTIGDYTLSEQTITNFEKITGALYQRNAMNFRNTSSIELNGGLRDDFISVKDHATVNAGAGNDIINLYGSDTVARGEDGNDTFWSFGPGYNVLWGGAGDDRYVIRASDVVMETADEGIDTVVVNFDYQIDLRVENLEMAGAVALQVGKGNALDNRITVTGAAGKVVWGYDGNDIITGHASAAGATDYFHGGNGDDTLYGNAGDDFLLGDAGNDHAEGGSGNDSVEGGDGDDWLSGGTGNDTITGGLGDDTLLGGDGDDTIDGGEGRDTASYADAKAGVAVDLSLTGAQDTQGGGFDTLAGIEDLVGSDFADTLSGDAAGNVIRGGEGTDTLYGNGGDDVLDGGYAGISYLFGGEGDDVLDSGQGGNLLDGGAGIDTVRFTDTMAGVIADLVAATAIHAEARTDTLAGIENLAGTGFADTLKGNAGANVLAGLAGDDILWGRGGADTLDGGSGADRLLGGAGKDLLTGGEGDDVFAFIALADSAVSRTGADRIADFVSGQDHLSLEAIDAVAGVAGNQAFSFIGDAVFGKHAGELRATTYQGNTYVSGDVNGDGAADFTIRLDGLHTLSAGDFLL